MAIAILVGFNACNDDESDDNKPSGSNTSTFEIKMNHVWGKDQTPFALNMDLVHPMTGDSLNFTTLNYYLSNIQLQKTDGTWWVDEESYYLVKIDQGTDFTFEIDNVPTGDYTAMKITHGVDSTRNVSGIQEGALSPSNGMFWSWNNGYIMFKAEGTSPQSSEGDFAFHLGGFMGDNNIVTPKLFEFGQSVLSISEQGKPQVHLTVNPAKLWHTVGSLSQTKTKIHMPGEKATIMAKDVFNGTFFDHIHP